MGLQDRIDIRAELPLRSFFVCVYVCRRAPAGAEYLLLQRTSRYLNGLWQPVTGRIEPGEKAWQTALREVREETGLTVATLYSANFVQQFYDVGQDCISVVPVFLAWVATDAPVVLSAEHGAWCWLDAEAARQRVRFAQQRDTITRIEEEFVTRAPLEFLRIDFEA